MSSFGSSKLMINFFFFICCVANKADSMYIPQIDGTLLSTMKKILLEVVFKMWGKVFFIMILKSFLLMSPV